MAETMFTHKLDEAQVRRLREVAEGKGFEFSPLEYGHFTARKGKCVMHAYLSGKLVVAGKEAKDFIEFTLEPEVLGEARLGYEKIRNPEMYAPHFGIDESGKGDLFGPLVVAGVFVDEDTADRLVEIGVRDSKTISTDKKIAELAEEIGKTVRGGMEVVTMGPPRYNELYRKFGNLNRLLAWAHGKVIANLHAKVPQCPRALSDQFGDPRLVEGELRRQGVEIQLQQRTKAESDIAVAAASILARSEFVRQLAKLSAEVGFDLAKGCGAGVKKMAEEIFRQRGREGLACVAKTHFRTFSEAVGDPVAPKVEWKKR
ncbi:MAG: ribonuclease HIII [Verrucomicrobia bacterium]|nr:ribonuclease HIII [Verrucomicrobiota bacterium]